MDKVTLSPNVSGLNQNLNLNLAKPVEKAGDNQSFGKLLNASIKDVDTAQKSADTMITKMASGENIDIHNTMIAIEKADISFQLMMQVRNKVVAAYQEIYRMQV